MVDSLLFFGPFMATGRTVVDAYVAKAVPAAGTSFRDSQRRIRIAAVVAPAFVLWLLLLVILPADFPFGNDQVAYLGGAAALRAGHGYRFEQYIGLPRIGIYPPGYSLWLAAFWKGGQPISANSYRLEVANWIAAGAALFGLAACLFVSELPAGVCSLILILLGTSITFIEPTVSLMPDVLFVAGSCALALLITRYDPHRHVGRWWFLAGLTGLVLCTLRLAGIAYILGLAAYGLWKGDLRRVSRLAYFALPGCATLLWVLLRRGIPTDITLVQISAFGGWGPFLSNTLRLAGLYASGRWLVEGLLNATDRLSIAHALHRFSFGIEAAVFVLAIGLFALPILAGVLKSWRRPKEQLVLFILGAYLLLLILWPYYDGGRFGIPLVPFVVGLLWRGLSFRVARAVFLVVMAVNVPGNVWLSYKILESQGQQARRDLTELQRAAAWINTMGGADARVMAARDVPVSHLYEYLGRRVLANAGPNLASNYVDVYPAAQNDQWADYAVIDESFYPAGVAQRLYTFRQHFGRWTVASPRR